MYSHGIIVKRTKSHTLAWLSLNAYAIKSLPLECWLHFALSSTATTKWVAWQFGAARRWNSSLTFGQMNTFPRCYDDAMNALSNRAAQREQYMNVPEHILHFDKRSFEACQGRTDQGCSVGLLGQLCSHSKHTAPVFKWNRTGTALTRLISARQFFSTREYDCCVIYIQMNKVKEETPPCFWTWEWKWKHPYISSTKETNVMLTA